MTRQSGLTQQGPATQSFRQGTLVTLRWLALAGQAVTLVIVTYLLDLDLPILPAMTVVFVAGVVNVAFAIWRPGATRLSEGQSVAMLAFDLLQLGALLGLTGGLQNPFAVLLLAPVAAAAWALSWQRATILACLALAIVPLLGLWSWPLPWPEGASGQNFHQSPLFLWGQGVALSVAIIFIAGSSALLAREKRLLGQALEATALALSREQRLSALGGLAAATAHELGTPLGTLRLVAKELDQALPSDSPHRADLDILLGETERCREILERLGRNPDQDGGAPYNLIPMTALVEAALASLPGATLGGEPSDAERQTVQVTVPSRDDWTPPMVVRDPQVIHGLASLLENACEFAAGKVEVRLESEGEAASLVILDDGPGFDPTRLSEVGTPYFTTADKGRRAGKEVHSGLGIFIAQTLLAHSGAKLIFENRAGGGAQVTVYWPQGLAQAPLPIG